MSNEFSVQGRAEQTMKQLDLRHIVCAVDLSRSTPFLLRQAGAIARVRGAEFRALHVVNDDRGLVPTGLSFLRRDALMTRLREKMTDALVAYPLVGAAVRAGDPGTEILRFAKKVQADVIVMGAPGGVPEAVTNHQVTSVVVPRSDCAVLIVPSVSHVNGDGVFRRIVCGVDMSPSSMTLIRQAASLAWETHARLIYVCVVPELTPSIAAAVRSALWAAIPEGATDWCEIAIAVTAGPPSLEILKLTEEERADLIVIGAPRRWTSAAHAVFNGAPCPVMVAHDARPLPWPSAHSLEEQVSASL